MIWIIKDPKTTIHPHPPSGGGGASSSSSSWFFFLELTIAMAVARRFRAWCGPHCKHVALGITASDLVLAADTLPVDRLEHDWASAVIFLDPRWFRRLLEINDAC